jgi:ArsR family transcriptional regulator
MKFGGNIMTNKKAVCSVNVVHEKEVKKARSRLPKEEVLLEIADLLRMFGDSTRIKIVYALDGSELCVCDLANVINTSQSVVSHQLRILRQAKMVKYRREGKMAYYSLNDDKIILLIKNGLEYVKSN